MKKHLMIISLLLVLICFGKMLNAQQPKISRVFFDMNNSVKANAIVNTYDQGFLICGQRSGSGLIMKLDAEANLGWALKIGDDYYEEFRAIVPTHDSCFLVAGESYSEGDSHAIVYYIKINIEGDTLWSKSIDFGYWCAVSSLQQTSDHGFILAGNLSQTGNPYSKMFVARLDPDGNVVWARNYSAFNNENKVNSIRVASEGNFILTGMVENLNPYLARPFVIEISSLGDIIWSKSYAIPGSDFYTGTGLIIDDNAAFISLFSFSYFEPIVMKTDLSGNVLWSNKYQSYTSFNYYNYYPPMHKTSDNHIVFVTPGQFGQLLKIRMDGSLSRSGNLFMEPVDVIENPDHGLMIVGNGPIFGVKKKANPNPHIGVILADSAGNGIECTFDYTMSIENIIIDTTSITFSWQSSFAQTHLSLPVLQDFPDIKEGCVDFIGGVDESPEDESAFRIFPNPTNGLTAFVLDSNHGSSVQCIQIVNYKGQVWNYQVDFGKQACTLDLTSLPDGIYLARIISGSEGYTRKLVIRH
jgi:hypothetical protein